MPCRPPADDLNSWLTVYRPTDGSMFDVMFVFTVGIGYCFVTIMKDSDFKAGPYPAA